MDQNSEEIVRELLALDPTLKNEEEFVRALVGHMVKTKPFLVPSMALKSIVRAQLLARHALYKKAPVFEWPWWVSYAVPVAFVFVLYISTTPPLGVPANVYEKPVSMSSGDLIQSYAKTAEQTPELVRAAAAPSAQKAAETVGLTDEPLLNEVFVLDQKAGFVVSADLITLNQPGFALVKDSEGGEILGVSSLLSAARQGPVVIYLSEETKVGKAYDFQIYIDDGDGVFSEDLDGSLRYSQFFQVIE
jgi:hypothetical protein